MSYDEVSRRDCWSAKEADGIVTGTATRALTLGLPRLRVERGLPPLRLDGR